MPSDDIYTLSRADQLRLLKTHKTRQAMQCSRRTAWGHLTGALGYLAREYVQEDKELSGFMGNLARRGMDMQRKINLELLHLSDQIRELETIVNDGDMRATWRELRDEARDTDEI